ncbi:ankyrin repeat-containing protein At5g02620-like [Oryza brachyantha]|nr:ankyrin repeat-containing protein At5g02620-like [Oryza brachyantha]XP_015697800.1 ankyrin repeat-containing protein At5g02620-like [Oryza brachyantha]
MAKSKVGESMDAGEPSKHAPVDHQGKPLMEQKLLKAATLGSFQESDGTTKVKGSLNRSMLLGRTAQGNTCLHISSMHGYERFCSHVLELDDSLLAAVNSHGETPLLIAITSGHPSLASFFLSRCNINPGLSGSILTQDCNGCNALHHAIRSGYRDLALELINAQPDLSKGVNIFKESPMYLALTKGFEDVFHKLFAIPDSADSGTYSYNVLHAAVKNGNPDVAKEIVESREWLARQADETGNTPVHMAIRWGNHKMLRVLLEQDWTLGYLWKINKKGETEPLLVCAAYQGHVNAAEVLLEHCPDAPYCREDGWTCLHEAIRFGHLEFVKFILRHPQLGKLINMRDEKGKTALHHAVCACNPKIVAALLRKRTRIDYTMLDKQRDPAIWELKEVIKQAKTLNWSEVSMLILEADPGCKSTIANLHKKAKREVTKAARNNAKDLTKMYTNNTSVVAILIASITFAAAFTLPGGYSSTSGSEGLPIMARKIAFKAFLVSDTLAMLSSLSVAFICVLARWEDLEFLLYYRSTTKKLMWFAYMTTAVAFATGLYTVLAAQLMWFAIGICVLSVLMPILTKVLGEWPILKLRIQFGPSSVPESFDMV